MLNHTGYWAGLLFCLGSIFFLRGMERQRQARMGSFAAAHLLGRLTRNISPGRRLLKKGLWLLAMFCCFLALARPQYGFRWVEVKRQGIDILFALDTSKSMLTEDIRPNRLERAKLAIIDFVNQLDGDRVGLLPFAGSAFLMCPLTIDYTAFEESLATVNTDIIPRGGTDLAKAIELAESSLLDTTNHKILILLTDGENLQGDALAAATKAAKDGMTIYTVGVGTTKGELIPLPGGGPGRFVQDESGKFITSRLDATGLTAIAKATGGLYEPLGKNGEGLERIYQQKLSLIPKQEVAEKQHKEPLERSSWPLGAAILLLMVEFMVSGRKAERSFRLPFIKTAGRRLRKESRKIVALFLLMTVAGLDQARASKGEEAFAAGDYLSASKFYTQALKKHPDDPRLHYNAGTAAYKNNLYDDAITSFQEALKTEDLGLQEQTYYNLGNARYKKGEELLQKDPEQAEKMWRQAKDAYEGSIKLNPEDRESKENLALVAKKLEDLKKQQEQQQKQQQGQNDQQEQDQKQKQDQKQQPQTGDQQGQKGKEGQQENQEKQGQEGKQEQKNKQGQEGKQGQQQNKDSAADRNKSSAEEKNQGDQKGKVKEQPAGTSSENDRKPEQGAAQAENEDRQKVAAARAAQAGKDEERRQSGRMTSEEARQLLSRLKDEEGRLNFVPQRENGEAEKEGTWKDW